MGQKYTYFFGGELTEGEKSMRSLLGGKGANLAEMCRIGLPIPPGFTVTTEACANYHQSKDQISIELEEQIIDSLNSLEKFRGARFGDPDNPLMLSVRSGAAISMPGMMDTVLNLGINDEVLEGIANKTGNRRFALDLYRRFIDMFGDVVMGVKHSFFDKELISIKNRKGVQHDQELDIEDLEELIQRYQRVYEKHVSQPFPKDPLKQLLLSVSAVFRSWNTARAVKYRQIHSITHLFGTAVNVQCMVFGNMGESSGTGVLFTRNPATGEDLLYGEYLINAQGEDVVAGIRTPEPIAKLEKQNPVIYKQILGITQHLESHFKDMQDVEFTIEEGELFILQTRTGKRSGEAALRIAVEMVENGLVDKAAAVSSLVSPDHLNQLLHPHFKDLSSYKDQILAIGLPASPGAAVGTIVFSAEAAENAAKEGKAVILLRIETSAEDVGGMHAAAGILTARGGMTSHAAVVARGWGKCCVAGCKELDIDYGKLRVQIGEEFFGEGDYLSLNGTTGEVVRGRQELEQPQLSGNFETFMSWVDPFRKIGVRGNADNGNDAQHALDFGAQGIGLCRTEHMFFEENRILLFQEMIIAATEEDRRLALSKLLPFQKADFLEIFRIMAGLPVTIRLLDPPLHEFLPHDLEEQKEVAKDLGVSLQRIHNRLETLIESNPMMGHRGCRLGIVYPEITEMQTKAILGAALELKREGVEVIPEIMIPLVGTLEEFRHQKNVVQKVANQLFEQEGESIHFLVGTMIEVPRAALMADELAKEAEFFSFGTNDLTQMTFGFSRDDATKFLPNYIEKGILPDDPFQTLDQEGVGKLLKIAKKKGRTSSPHLKLGICGEHGGDPASVEFCCRIGLDYLSCSPFRLPLARLAAAQAALKMGKEEV